MALGGLAQGFVSGYGLGLAGQRAKRTNELADLQISEAKDKKANEDLVNGAVSNALGSQPSAPISEPGTTDATAAGLPAAPPGSDATQANGGVPASTAPGTQNGGTPAIGLPPAATTNAAKPPINRLDYYQGAMSNIRNALADPKYKSVVPQLMGKMKDLSALADQDNTFMHNEAAQAALPHLETLTSTGTTDEQKSAAASALLTDVRPDGKTHRVQVSNGMVTVVDDNGQPQTAKLDDFLHSATSVLDTPESWKEHRQKIEDEELKNANAIKLEIEKAKATAAAQVGNINARHTNRLNEITTNQGLAHQYRLNENDTPKSKIMVDDNGNPTVVGAGGVKPLSSIGLPAPPAAAPAQPGQPQFGVPANQGAPADSAPAAAPTAPEFPLSKWQPNDRDRRWNPDTQKMDGPPKGWGFFGPLARTDGATMSEYSIDSDINGKRVSYPSLVPTLTKDEVRAVLSSKDGQKLPDSVYQKAEDWARTRIAQGKSPFAEPDEEGKYSPGQAVQGSKQIDAKAFGAAPPQAAPAAAAPPRAAPTFKNNGKGGGGTNSMKKYREMVDLGVPTDIAKATAYGTFRQVQDPRTMVTSLVDVASGRVVGHFEKDQTTKQQVWVADDNSAPGGQQDKQTGAPPADFDWIPGKGIVPRQQQ
jgi:hypothetical protein